jgi:hypothetical protein
MRSTHTLRAPLSEELVIESHSGDRANAALRSCRRNTARPGRVRSHPNLLVVTLIGSIFLNCPARCKAQSQVDEYRLKAAFLFHFAQFVEWPTEALGNIGDSFVLCTVGDDPFHGDLEETIRGKTIDGRTVRIRHLKRKQEPRGCNVLFIDKDESSNVVQWAAALRRTSVLTVGESNNFLQQGGMIRVFVEDQKIRFEINQEAAESANLRVSSRLLLLARTVNGASKR